MINSLRVFLEIYTQLDQGIHFYQQAIALLGSHHQKVSDFVIARAMEANNL